MTTAYFIDIGTSLDLNKSINDVCDCWKQYIFGIPDDPSGYRVQCITFQRIFTYDLPYLLLCWGLKKA